MPQSKVLVDTNSYLRLARSIHPLLFQTFGKDEYCLYVLPELDEEFGKSQRLQNNFSWAKEEEYQLNRQHFPVVSKKQIKEVDTAFGYIWDHIISVEKGPSPVDARYLAYAYVLGITVVTDDIKMLAVAESFGIKTLKSLDLKPLRNWPEIIPTFLSLETPFVLSLSKGVYSGLDYRASHPSTPLRMNGDRV